MRPRKENNLEAFSDVYIDIYVIGYSHQGESILFVLYANKPEYKVVYSMVIDCYEENINITKELLDEILISKKTLDMLVWTHPHDDHTKGLEQLIDNYCSKDTKIILANILGNKSYKLSEECQALEQKISKLNKGLHRRYDINDMICFDNEIQEIQYCNADTIQNLTIRCVAPIPSINAKQPAKEKINILFIASNPDIEFIDDDGNSVQQQKLKLEKEAREIHESIQKSLKRDSISFETRWATRVTDLLQFINEVNPTILHFSGHGTSDGKLVFQDNNDKPKLLSMEALVELINASSDNLRLVVLNNCFSSIISEKIVDNIEASIGMNSSIGDQAAIVFASQLYSSIGFGLSLEKAFQQAIVSLKLYEIPEDQTPQLYVSEGIEAKNIYLVTKN